jgi:hypothetical protein
MLVVWKQFLAGRRLNKNACTHKKKEMNAVNNYLTQQMVLQ